MKNIRKTEEQGLFYHLLVRTREAALLASPGSTPLNPC